MESKTPLADGIRNVIFRRRMNYSIIITGRPQLRKSTVAIGIAMDITRGKFDLTRDMGIIKTKKYLEILDTSAKRGAVKILDEFGVGMNHRAWYGFLNQAMSYVMQTHGHEGKVVIVTSPYEDYVDKDARKLFNMIIEMQKKNDRKGYAIGRVAEMQYNEKMKKIYYKLPRGRFPDGVIRRINAFKFKYPPKDIMDEYFKEQSEIKLTLKSELTAQAGLIEIKKMGQTFNPDDYVKKILENPDKFTKEWQGKTIVVLENIMNEFVGIGRYRAMRIKSKAEVELKTIGKEQA